MTNEERDLIAQFHRAGRRRRCPAASRPGPASAAAAAAGRPRGGRLIADLFIRYPEARYRITQPAFVQEHALVAAQNRIQQLEWELQQAQQALAAGAAAGRLALGRSRSSLVARLLRQAVRRWRAPGIAASPRLGPPRYQGSRRWAPSSAAAAAIRAGLQPGMFPQRGSGFLGSALTTAAGVAGGMVAGNALMSLFSGGHGGFGGAASPAATEFIPVQPGGGVASDSPWAAPPAAAPVSDPYDVGGADKGVADNSGWSNVDQGGWQQPVSDTGGWSDAQNVDTGGWSDPGSNSSDAGGGDDWS